jgi:hypothetical protein
MALRQVPLFSLPLKAHSAVSIRITTNKYLYMVVTTDGRLLANEKLAGFYTDQWSLTACIECARIEHMEIVGTVEYHEHIILKGGV